MERDNVHIQHAENGGEIRNENYEIDGFDKENNCIYEYHGCYHHKHFCQNWYDEEIWNKIIKCLQNFDVLHIKNQMEYIVLKTNDYQVG